MLHLLTIDLDIWNSEKRENVQVLEIPHTQYGLFSEMKSTNCNLSSPSFLEWDALTVFLESVMSKVNLPKQPEADIQKGIALLKSVLQYETQVSSPNL